MKKENFTAHFYFDSRFFSAGLTLSPAYMNNLSLFMGKVVKNLLKVGHNFVKNTVLIKIVISIISQKRFLLFID